jgi:hypothetical protein
VAVTPTPKRSFPAPFNFINMVGPASALEKEDDATTISSALSSVSSHHESRRLTKNQKRRREEIATDLNFVITQNAWKQLLGRIAKLETTVELQEEDYNNRRQRYKKRISELEAQLEAVKATVSIITQDPKGKEQLPARKLARKKSQQNWSQQNLILNQRNHPHRC